MTKSPWATIILGGTVWHRDREEIDRIISIRGLPGLVVAADAGADWAAELRLRPDIIIGDMDSVHPEALADWRNAGVPVSVVPREKDDTDAQLAVEHCLRKGFRDLVLIGGLGGRLDHTLANIVMIAGYMAAGQIRSARMIGGGERLVILYGPQPPLPLRGLLGGEKGQLVSLIPLTPQVGGVTVQGVKWPLRDCSLGWGKTLGISNVIQDSDAWISLESGVLLVFQPR